MRKFRTLFSRMLSIGTVLCLTAVSQIGSYAMTVKPDITVDEFNNYTGDNVVGMLLGITFWICRLFGVVIIMWGIYSIVTAKKDGDADSINISIIKLMFGVVLVGMPSIMRALGIIQ